MADQKGTILEGIRPKLFWYVCTGDKFDFEREPK